MLSAKNRVLDTTMILAYDTGQRFGVINDGLYRLRSRTLAG